MAEYPGSEHETRIMPATLAADVAAIFAACGMSADDAARSPPPTSAASIRTARCGCRSMWTS